MPVYNSTTVYDSITVYVILYNVAVHDINSAHTHKHASDSTRKTKTSLYGTHTCIDTQAYT